LRFERGFEMGEVGQITEYVSDSAKGFDDAVRKAVAEMSQKHKDIRGVDVLKMTAKVKDGKIYEYRVNLKVSSGL